MTTHPDWRQEEKRAAEEEMVGWHHHLDGHEFEQTPGDSEGQGSLACCSPWGCKESDTTEQLNSNKWVNNGNITNLFEGTVSVFLFKKKKMLYWLIISQ